MKAKLKPSCVRRLQKSSAFLRNWEEDYLICEFALKITWINWPPKSFGKLLPWRTCQNDSPSKTSSGGFLKGASLGDIEDDLVLVGFLVLGGKRLESYILAGDRTLTQVVRQSCHMLEKTGLFLESQLRLDFDKHDPLTPIADVTG